MRRPSPRRSSCLRRRWASGSSVPRTRSGRPASRSASRSARSFPAGSSAVLDAIYAAFAEGWTDPGGTDVARRDLTEEAMFLARLVTELLPEEPEALGLLALMLHAEARRRARRSAQRRIRAARRAGSGVVGLANDRRGRGAAPAGRLWARSAAISWKPRCSRRTSIAAARVTPTGRRSCSSTTRCSRSPARRWSPSIAPWPSRSCTAPPPRSRRCRLAADARLAEYQPYWAARAELLAKTGARRSPPRLRDRHRSRARPAVRRFLQQRQSALNY